MTVHFGTKRECERVLQGMNTLGLAGEVVRYRYANNRMGWATTGEIAGWAATALKALLFDHGVRADRVSYKMLKHYDEMGKILK